ncbi:hypothetical protein BH23PLA1_BH23PLA1_15610 [soil metagenome]
MPPAPLPEATPERPLDSDRDREYDRDRHGRRAVWITFGITLSIAAIVYVEKAQEDRSAIIRWLYQVRELQEGTNIWENYIFPNPPIFPLSLYPLTYLPETGAAVAWYVLKIALTVLAILMCFRIAREPDERRPLLSWVQGLILLLSFRPILSDLHHANNNLVILFLIVATLYAWRKGYDVLAGLLLALAITYKVTPALFVPYFMYKRSWRTVGATFLGIGIFLLAVPSLILGPEFNGKCLYYWWFRMIRPYVADGIIGDPEINQSMAGVLMRLLTFQPPRESRYAPASGLNLLSLDPKMMVTTIKALSVALVLLLAYFCRTRTGGRRTDPRMLGEFSLIVLTMLFVSERSWKHHYVTLLLPYTYLVLQLQRHWPSKPKRWILGTGLGASALLMLSTSSEVGGIFAGGDGHKLAQYYGMFFWAGVVLYGLTAWRVVVEGRAEPTKHAAQAKALGHELPPPHLGRKGIVSREPPQEDLGRIQGGS